MSAGTAGKEDRTADTAHYKKIYLKSINNQLFALFNYACRYYVLAEDPAKTCGFMGISKADKMKFWTLDEFKLFQEAINDKIISKTIFNLLYWSGMRSGEMMALTLEDFDFEAQAVEINKNYTRLNREDLILEPKTPKSNRSISLPTYVCELVEDYTARLVDYEPDERLLDVTKGFLYHDLEHDCKKSGVKWIRIHDIRHSHASLLVEMEVYVLYISKRLSHKDIQTTLETYAHLYPHKNEQVMDKMNTLCI